MALRLEVYCKDHPKYKAKRKPKECPVCRSIYRMSLCIDNPDMEAMLMPDGKIMYFEEKMK